MIPRDAQPIGHHSPLPRIDLGARKPAPDAGVTWLDMIAENARQAEGERIWKLLEQAAQGGAR